MLRNIKEDRRSRVYLQRESNNEIKLQFIIYLLWRVWLPVHRGLLPFCHKRYEIYPHIGCTASVPPLRFETRPSCNPKFAHIELVVYRSPVHAEDGVNRTVAIVHPLFPLYWLTWFQEVPYSNTSSVEFIVYSDLVLGRKLRGPRKVNGWKWERER
jgi:hypothetical protein